MRHSLSKDEVNKRLIRLRNIERLYEIARVRIDKQNKEIQTFRKEIDGLKSTIGELMGHNEKLTLRVEELLTIVFGKKKEKKDNNIPPSPQQREKDSYKRPIPKKEDITNTKYHKLSECSCSGKLLNKRIREYYEEDIILPTKTVTHHKVEQGYYAICRKWSSATVSPQTTVTLGNTIQKYVCYATTILRLSYSQTKDHLHDTFNINLSEGEITKILHRIGAKHQEDYNSLTQKIRKESVIHMDETSTRIRDGDGYNSYTWLMRGIDIPEIVLSIGRTRGKGVAEELLGNSNATGITDHYAVYDKLFKNHQLCWAHLHRKFRDLKQSMAFEGKEQKSCLEAYEKESLIYKQVINLASKKLTNHQRKIWYRKLTDQLVELAIINLSDPPKLQTYKKTLKCSIPKYLTCILHEGIPPDNNCAERTLRHYVLKRKISFGHITQRGAKTMSILMSVFMTIKNRMKDTKRTFFEEYDNFCVGV